ncbi:MAG TPA: GAP family protein, partial [Solirubrobacteraceae bacterium]|nr:GAP family protein [Solirubrobacteraceae bacterium]
MLHLLGLMISIGLVDSLNPSTIGPALYLASGYHPRRRVAEFTLAVFLVYLAGGVLIALGPGELILDLVPHPHRTARHIGEIVAGALLIISAV